MGNNKRELLLVVAAVLCIGALAGDKFVVTPLWNLWIERGENIAALEQRLEKGEMLMGREEAMRQRWEALQERGLSSNVSIAENRVLSSVNRWARDSRLSLTGLTPRWDREGEDFRKLEYRATGRGSLQAITRFLYEAEKDPMALNVENISLVARDENGASLTLDVRFTVLVAKDASS